MENICDVPAVNQETTLSQVRPERNRGIEIVNSANFSRRFYSGPRPGRRSAPRELSTQDRITLLRGQLRLLRMRAEAGMFVSPDAIGRAERLAGSLEAAA